MSPRFQSSCLTVVWGGLLCLDQELRERASPGYSLGSPFGEPHFPSAGFPLRRVLSEDPGRDRVPQLRAQRARPFVLGYTGRSSSARAAVLLSVATT